MTLGQRIKAHRKRLGLSQDALAERMEVSRQAVTKWESGKSYPSTEKLLRLAVLFECSVDELSGSPFPVDTPLEREPTPQPSEPAPTPAQPAHAPQMRTLEPLRRNCAAALLTMAVWLGWFLLCKLIWADLGDQTVLSWLFGDSPRYHDYLFGWLLDKFWWCAGISSAAALLGWRHFSVVSTAAFFLGMLLGEPLGTLGMPPGVHQGWIIWGGVYLAGLVFAIIAQRRRAAAPWRSRLWWFAAALCIAAVITLSLTSAPAHG